MSTFLNDSYGNSKLSASQVMSDATLCLAFGFGSGLSRYMPGTFGTLAAVPVYWLLMQTNILVYSAVTLVVVVAGIGICGYAAEKLEMHDFRGIVWDEIAGFLLTMWWVPFSWNAVLSGFIVFRFFDIAKPWPIKWADRQVGGGLGIMLDDVLAGLFSAVVMWLIFCFSP